MARIRTIKPEFWDSPSTARASAVARLAYIAMWNWADDYGRGTANLKELEGFIFPNDDVAELSGGHARCFRSVVAEVSECFGVLFYNVDGRPYFAIPAWESHQRNERRAKASKYPGPDDPGSTVDPLTWGYSAEDKGGADDARYFRSGVAETPNSSGLGTGEQGNRGTGEQIEHAHLPVSVTDPEPEPEPEPESKRPARVTRFEDFWEAYPRKVGKQAARKAYAAAVKRCGDEAIVVEGAGRVAADPNLPDSTFIPHPATWLNRDGWDDEPFPVRLPDRNSRGGSFAARDWLDVARDGRGGDVVDGQVVESDPLSWPGSGPSNAASFSLEAGPADGRLWA